MSASSFSQTELLIAVVARMLDGLGHVAVGASSPIPGAAALLARARSTRPMRVTVLGSEAMNDFTDGAREIGRASCRERV